MSEPAVYQIRKDTRTWLVERIHADDSRTKIGSFKTRREAVNTSRLLAGWRGLVRLQSQKGGRA